MKTVAGDDASAAPRLQEDIARLLRGEHANPHAILGAHRARDRGRDGWTVRVRHPTAAAVDCLVSDAAQAMQRVAPEGLFELFLPGGDTPPRVSASPPRRERRDVGA